ncbi:MAG: hypothetical protein KGZ59_03675 [Chitinophagaceae bacterium]|nr:hypothetical protein [Chitinophagaceae bacterium]
MSAKIQLIPAQNIDAQLWDQCVHQNHAPIYLQYSYLNTMSLNWIGLVLGNYAGIMPICYKQKWGIRYSYTPAFIQQLGWVGEKIDFKILESTIYEFVRYGDVMLNHENDFKLQNITSKTNLIIHLNQSYDNISSYYSNDLIQNLKKASKENLKYLSSNEITQAIHLYKKLYSNRLSKTTQIDYDNFLNLCLHLNENGNCFVRKVVNTENELLSIALLLKDDCRIYNIANATTDLGRKTAANHFLIDQILKEFSTTDLIFDFEGSDLPGVKSFYENFAPIHQPYYHWHFNKLWFLPNRN